MKKTLLLISTLLMSHSLSAFDIDLSAGAHDFVVSNISNDTPNDGISAGTSHTLGLNIGIIANHTTPSNIHLMAKAEAFWDRDKDHLDPDHIPIWFNFIISADGPMYTINIYNHFKWYVLMDNKQNTVSCIERQVRQHVGAGYEFNYNGFTFDTNVYMGFYYIEMDDDTPVARGYTRQDTDDGEASNIFELKMAYKLNKNFTLSGYAKQYSANARLQHLERDYELLVRYKNLDFLAKNSSLNFEIKHSKYNLDRFFRDPPGIAILPFDNDTLIQASVTLPLKY